MDETRCVVCGEVKHDGKVVVDNPLPKHIDDLLKHAKTLVENGDIKYQVLAKYAELSEEKKADLRYHRVCRQGILKLKRPAVQTGGYATPAKRGRPTNKAANQTRKSFRSPDAAKPKEKKRVFAPHFCEWDGRDDLHKVESDNRGYELMGIKKKLPMILSEVLFLN